MKLNAGHRSASYLSRHQCGQFGAEPKTTREKGFGCNVSPLHEGRFSKAVPLWHDNHDALGRKRQRLVSFLRDGPRHDRYVQCADIQIVQHTDLGLYDELNGNARMSHCIFGQCATDW